MGDDNRLWPQVHAAFAFTRNDFPGGLAPGEVTVEQLRADAFSCDPGSLRFISVADPRFRSRRTCQRIEASESSSQRMAVSSGSVVESEGNLNVIARGRTSGAKEMGSDGIERNPMARPGGRTAGDALKAVGMSRVSPKRLAFRPDPERRLRRGTAAHKLLSIAERNLAPSPSYPRPTSLTYIAKTPRYGRGVSSG